MGGAGSGEHLDESAMIALVHSLLRELHPHARPRPIALGMALDRDLGLDSLARIELAARIERAFGVNLPESVFTQAETLRDLHAAVVQARGARVSSRLAPVHPAAPAAGTPPADAHTLTDVLHWHVAQHPDELHLRLIGADDRADDTLTYRELQAGALALAAGLQARGVQAGERVAIMLPTGREYFFSFFGALYAGAVPVPLYPPARLSQIEDHLRRQRGILVNCEAVLLITVPEAQTLARLLRAQVDSLGAVVTPEELARAPGAPQIPVRQAEDIALLQYTSGSTGNPKGVVLSHTNLLANIRAMGNAIDAGPGDVFVSWLPLYHDMGLIGAWLGSLYFGLPVTLMSPLTMIARPQRWLWAIHQARGTLSAGPNFAYELCLRRIADEDIKGLDLSSWRIAFNGAEPVSADTIDRFYARFAAYGFRREAMMPVYGLAECSVGLTFPPLDRGPRIDPIARDPLMRHGQALPAVSGEPHAVRMVACGRPLPGHAIRIVDANGHELPERRVGHLQFRGPSATRGYFHNPEETRRLFVGDWLDSGDLAYTAEDDVFITGRSKDLIIRGGRNISPHELEAAIGELPGIRKGCVAVLGSYDVRAATERLVIIAETRERDDAALASLRQQVDATTTEIAGEPADEVVLARPGAVLKTSSGKIRRGATRARYERGELEAGQRRVWRQFLRLALTSVAPSLRRLGRALVGWLYGGYAWLLVALFALPVWLGVVLLPDSARRWSFMRTAARFLLRAAGIALRVHDGAQLPKGPCIFVANHASYIDGPVLIAALPRAVSFVAKGELARSAFARLFLERIDAQFVERFDLQRGAADARRLADAARDGHSLLFFAEGTFTHIPGLLPFHLGAFVAAAQTRLPIVPIALRGTRHILRSESWLPRRGDIDVIVGAPLDPAAWRAEVGDEVWPLALKLRDEARAHILAHVGEPDLAAAFSAPADWEQV
jgi:1-acyl-sn-glycerol-3-phosphate acyltransferase